MSRGQWQRREGGYMRRDGAWFLERGARMADAGTNAWLIHRRVTEERIGRDSTTIAFDNRNGDPLWSVDAEGWTSTERMDFTGDLYAHDWDAGSLAEAKYTVEVVEAEEVAA